MYSEQLISKQGPLGHVWLAANYDKKLSKQQLLNTSIVKTSEIILTHPVSHSSTQASDTDETITLRLSGQLLLGIVRIYSRKTKYLLDDVNDILLKLKNSFKYASGVTLGSENTSKLINLEPQQTIITNLENITLADQITGFELLYQDELNLVDDVNNLFSQVSANEDSFTFDQSIEYPRHNENNNVSANDLDLELDFDLDDDMSVDETIEVGRNTSQQQIDNHDISILSGLKDTTAPTFDFDLDIPLETIEDEPSRADTPNETEEPLTPTNIHLPRKIRAGLNDEGELITNKRKLIVDSLEELEGISIQTLKENQQLLLDKTSQDKYLKISESEKIHLIYELSTPIASKKRKLWSIDNDLQRRAEDILTLEKELEAQHELQFENDDAFDQIDFDLSLPGLDESVTYNEEEEEEIRESPVEFEEESVENVAKSTIQIADQLRDVFTKNDEVTNLSYIIEKDLKIHENVGDRLPLGIVNKSVENKTYNKRKEATKCFFELLVLATNDCISINQTSTETDIGGNIDIRSKDGIFNTFL